jgi:hypothetical protein
MTAGAMWVVSQMCPPSRPFVGLVDLAGIVHSEAQGVLGRWPAVSALRTTPIVRPGACWASQIWLMSRSR